MNIFVQTLRAGLRGLALPLVGALIVTYFCVQLAPYLEGTGADRSTGHWLHLISLLLVASALAAALESWPLFSRSRAGFGWVLRLRSDALHGCVPAALGTLTALAAALAVGGIAFYFMLSASGFDQGEVHGHITVEPMQERPFLDNDAQTLAFRSGDPRPIRMIRLRPSAIWSGGELRPARIRVLNDGVRSPSEKPWIENSGEPIALQIDPPKPVQNLIVHRERGPGLVLRLDAASIDFVTDATRPGALNSLFAALSYLMPALLAFAVMIFGHAHLALPVNFAAGLVTCVLATLLKWTPNTAAITAFARGRWLLDEPTVGWGVLATVAVAGVLVMLRGWRPVAR